MDPQPPQAQLEGGRSACAGEGACEEKGELPEMGTRSPPASGYQTLLCLSEQGRKLKPLMKRPPVFLQEKPPEGNGAVA